MNSEPDEKKVDSTDNFVPDFGADSSLVTLLYAYLANENETDLLTLPPKVSLPDNVNDYLKKLLLEM